VGWGVLVLLVALAPPAGADAQELSERQARQVLAVLQSPDGRSIQRDAGPVGRVLERVSGLEPTDMDVVKKLSEMKRILGDTAAYRGDPHLETIETGIMRRIFKAALAARKKAFAGLDGTDRRRFYAFGDVGSWDRYVEAGSPKYSTDMDFTVFSNEGTTAFDDAFATVFTEELGVSLSTVETHRRRAKVRVITSAATTSTRFAAPVLRYCSATLSMKMNPEQAALTSIAQALPAPIFFWSQQAVEGSSVSGEQVA